MYNPYYFSDEILIADMLSRQVFQNPMQISRKVKIVVSYTGKNCVRFPIELCMPLVALTYVTGQKAIIIRARQSVSSWKLRKNSAIGCKVSLRRRLALVFLEKLYIHGFYKCLAFGQQGFYKKKSYSLCQNFGSSPFPFFELYPLSINGEGFSGFSISIC